MRGWIRSWFARPAQNVKPVVEPVRVDAVADSWNDLPELMKDPANIERISKLLGQTDPNADRWR